MLITQTPFRVSFFGGGTDYPEYFEKHGGAVLGTAIDKYAYFFMTKFPSALFDYKIRIGYSKIECVNTIDEIEHVPFRECLRASNISKDVEIDYTAEMPSFSGLGTSSSFTVGLLNTLDAYQYKRSNPIELAYRAIEMERSVLNDCVGCQDQVFAALGGFNVVEFKAIDNIVISPIVMRPERKKEFEESLVIVFTGEYRRAGIIAKKQVEKCADNHERLQRMRKMVDTGYDILVSETPLEKFGELLDEMWQEKKQLDKSVCTGQISDLYDYGIASGAIGGKLLGAGGGGFILFYVPQDRKQQFYQKMNKYEILPVHIDAPGSRVVHMSSGRMGL